MHVKRQTIEGTWPVPRKGTKYLVVASDNKKNGIPVLIIIRDLMNLAKDRREVRKIILDKKVLVNDRVIRKDNFSVLPFDVIQIGDEKYTLGFSDNGKFQVNKTKASERTLKVIGKKLLSKKQVQLNLLYGSNIIEKDKIKIGDSVVIKDKKIIKTIELKEGKKAIILSGKHVGKAGKIEKIDEKSKIATIASEGKKINVSTKRIMAVD